MNSNCRGATVSKVNMTRKNCKMGGFTVTEILIVFALIALVAAVVVPRYARDARTRESHSGHMACINNLRILQAAKEQWALEQRKKKTDTPADSDIQPYCGRGSAGELPFCPDDPKQTFDTSYVLHNVGTNPTCKMMPDLHVLR